MKKLKNIFLSLLSITILFGCDNGIDSITQVDPGADASAPQITIKSPAEGTAIKVFEAVTSLDIEIEKYSNSI